MRKIYVIKAKLNKNVESSETPCKVNMHEGIPAVYANEFYAKEMIRMLDGFKADKWSFKIEVLSVIDFDPVYTHEDD